MAGSAWNDRYTTVSMFFGLSNFTGIKSVNNDVVYLANSEGYADQDGHEADNPNNCINV